MGKRKPGAPASDAADDAQWRLWYRDLFDRECPPSVELSGERLETGLKELWARYLFETVRPDGAQGFSRFHLEWDGTYVKLGEPSKAAARLRRWVFGRMTTTDKSYVDAADRPLLDTIALAHRYLIEAGRSGDELLVAVGRARDRRHFERLLEHLSRETQGGNLT